MEELPIRPRGIRFQPDFITKEHEEKLLHIFQHELIWPEPKKSGTRLSLHYGYTFDYKTFGVNPNIPYKPFPEWLLPLIPKLPKLPSEKGREGEEREEGRLPDQVCLQHYPPGAGIPPHVDTHSAYDELYALSLGSAVVMMFRRRTTTTEDTETETVDVDLPPRSMMQMSGESRLHWEHGIKKRKKDVLSDGTVRPRADRWSITYRWLRPGGVCECGDVKLCDTAQRRAGVEREFRWKQEKQDTGEGEETVGEGVQNTGSINGINENNGVKKALEVSKENEGLEHHQNRNSNIELSPS
ncbi:2OG-Fe(II) oxygenase [Xylaria flabelliformis]|nr:2OG-Fe(II) oxygenase [Xylaria flabelliformis]